MKIGELAKATGCSVQAIRHYEKENLLSSTNRSEGNFRIYGEHAVEQLSFIMRCRSLNLSLAEIGALLALDASPSVQCEEVNEMIDQHIRGVEERMAELRALRRQLKSLRESCSSDRTIEHCGILHSLRKDTASS